MSKYIINIIQIVNLASFCFPDAYSIRYELIYFPSSNLRQFTQFYVLWRSNITCHTYLMHTMHLCRLSYYLQAIQNLSICYLSPRGSILTTSQTFKFSLFFNFRHFLGFYTHSVEVMNSLLSFTLVFLKYKLPLD